MDLASVRNQTENDKISQIAEKVTNEPVWIGLFKGWTWSDQTNSVFTFWRTGIPDNSQGYEDCAVTWRNHKENGETGTVLRNIRSFATRVSWSSITSIPIFNPFLDLNAVFKFLFCKSA